MWFGVVAVDDLQIHIVVVAFGSGRQLKERRFLGNEKEDEQKSEDSAV